LYGDDPAQLCWWRRWFVPRSGTDDRPEWESRRYHAQWRQRVCRTVRLRDGVLGNAVTSIDARGRAIRAPNAPDGSYPARGKRFTRNAIRPYRRVIYACFARFSIARRICAAALSADATSSHRTKAGSGVSVFIIAVSTKPGCTSVTVIGAPLFLAS